MTDADISAPHAHVAPMSTYDDVIAARSGRGPDRADHAAQLARRYPAHREAERLYGPEFHRDPKATYQRLRARSGAVAPVLLDSDVPAWLVLGYRELRYVAGRADLFCADFRTWNAWDLAPPDWPLRPPVDWTETVISVDGPAHAWHAAAVDDALATIDLFDLAARCERIADGLIDVFAGAGTAELIGQYAARIPAVLGNILLGLAPADTDGFLSDLAVMLSQGVGARAAESRLRDAVRRQATARREQPGSDPMSRLVTHSAALSDDEAFEDLILLYLMAQSKTSAWIGNTLRLLLTDARFATTLAGGRRSVAQALAEVLWEDPPNSNVLGRWATRPLELGTRLIQQGDLLVLSVAAANADSRVRPDQGRPLGGSQAHLAFGAGTHRCPYPAQDVAQVVARTAVEVLLDRLPDLALAVPAEQLAWQPTVIIRGLAALPVAFTPA